jgi:GT2 family glycosyltransferase
VSPPSVSIILPTRNGMATLPDVLKACEAQRTSHAYEVVAVDSGSNDGTVDLLRKKVTQLIQIDARDFDHGRTRNLAIEKSRGELIVLLVQDAIPGSPDWLQALTAPLRSNAALAGTFARQLPASNASVITRHYHDRWSASSPIGRIYEPLQPAEFDVLSPETRMQRCTFDNVCSCVRRSVWAEHPFQPTPFGEDIAWAREVLLAGYRLAYVPEATIIHSHDRSARDEFTRTYLAHRLLYELFELRTIPDVPALVRAIASSLRLHSGLEPGPRAVALAIAWPLGQYLGARAAAHNGRAAASKNLR